MKIINSYVASDGKVFSNREDCLNYEKRIEDPSNAFARFFLWYKHATLQELPLDESVIDSSDIIVVLNKKRFLEYCKYDALGYEDDIDFLSLIEKDRHNHPILFKEDGEWRSIYDVQFDRHAKAKSFDTFVFDIERYA